MDKGRTGASDTTGGGRVDGVGKWAGLSGMGLCPDACVPWVQVDGDGTWGMGGHTEGGAMGE